MVRKKYFKGYLLERKVKEMLEREGWYVIRSAGSKKPDLIGGKEGNIIVVECKVSSKPTLYVKKEEIENLKRVGTYFKGICVYAIKYKGNIYFIKAENAVKKGETYLLSIEKNINLHDEINKI